MVGAPDPEYVKARRVLLDALQSLAPQGGALVLVGAQAIYLQVGTGGLAVAPHTTDADLVIQPSELAGVGAEMVVRATEGLEDPATIRASCQVLAARLLASVGGG